MDPILRALRELWDLRDVPIVTDRDMKRLADEGMKQIDEEARRLARLMGMD
jgi:hypothetical protein